MKFKRPINKIFRNKLVLKRQCIPLINEIKFELFYTYIKNLDFLYYEMRPVSKSESFKLIEFNNKKDDLINNLFYKIPLTYITLILITFSSLLYILIVFMFEDIDCISGILKEILRLSNVIELNDFISSALSIMF